MTEYAVMPKADYQDACDAVREKTGGTAAIKSGEIGDLIRNITSGGSQPATIGVINLHDTGTDIPDNYLQGETVIPYGGWTTTDFIPVEDGKFYLAYSINEIDPKYCSKFDANKANATALSVTINCTNKNRPVFISGHDGYLRFSGTTEQINALEFYEVINFDWKV